MRHSYFVYVSLGLLLSGSIASTAFAIEAINAVDPVDPVDSSLETKKPEILKVAGAVQFVDGRITKTESTGPVSALAFKSAIYENDRIDASIGSTLKVASRAGCLIISRNEAQLTAAAENRPWRIKGKSLRFICRLNSPQSFNVNEQTVTIRDGEVLITSTPEGSNLLPLRGAISINRQPLEIRKLYSWVQGAPKEVPTDESVLRTLNESEKPPRESAAWPAPPKPSNVRLMFGPVFVRERVWYDNANLSKSGLKGDGPRLQLQFRTKTDRSLIVALSFFEADSRYDDRDNNSSTPDGAWPQTSHFLLEIGERRHHERWWSTYYRFGAGEDSVKIPINRSNNGYSNYRYVFYVLSAAYGIDAHLAPKFLGGLGVFAGLEAYVAQSLWRGERANENPGYSGPPIEEPWRSTSVGALANAGVEYNF